MLIKHCVHCKTIFMTASMDELSRLFCATCAGECHTAIADIEHYRLDFPTATPILISQALAIPLIYVQTLFRQGRFISELKSHRNAPKIPCSVCRRALKPSEDVYCAECEVLIQHRTHSGYRKTAAAVKPNKSPFSPANANRITGMHAGLNQPKR